LSRNGTRHGLQSASWFTVSWEFSADFSHFRKKYPVFCVNLHVLPTTQACLEECSHVAGGGLTLPVAGASVPVYGSATWDGPKTLEIM